MKITKITFAIILCTFPILYIAMLSLADGFLYPALLPNNFSLKRYTTLFSDTNGIASAFILSLTTAFFVAATSTFIGFITSRAIAYSKNATMLLFFCYLPIALSPVVFASTIHFYFIYLNISGSIVGIILAQLFIALPFSILLLNSFWNTNITALENTSYTLGANFKTTLLKVLLPIAKPALLVCFFQTFLLSWFEYGLTAYIGVGKVQTLTIKVFQYISEANIYYAALASCVIILPVIILLWINKRFVFTKIN